VELLSRALRDNGSPYADVVDAAGAARPALRRSDLTVAARAVRDGPAQVNSAVLLTVVKRA
jgi:hypothetical protein